MADVSSDSDLNNCVICNVARNANITLKCKHNFCYLCVKQILMSKTTPSKCPMCRADIDNSLFEEAYGDIVIIPGSWAFSGRNDGWWAYDNDTNQIIEDAYRKGENSIKITVLGAEYTISFESMEQIGRKTTRKIKKLGKKDVVKGVSGLRTK